MPTALWKHRDDGTVEGAWWHVDQESHRIVCDLCPRQCHLKPGDRGFCFVRKNDENRLVLDTYGKSTGFCIDPIEKKPLNHFYPGTSVLSFGTAGCNLGCKFCQNWDISKSREVARLSDYASPEAIAQAALDHGCQSVAFTYNDPVIWAEYAIDTAIACHERNLKAVAVTAGYISPEARRTFFEHMDAANVDLKAFTEEFYWKTTYSHLAPVLDTLRYLRHETDVWFEITNLVIPRENDSTDELKKMCDWILQDLGPDVPIHFSAFHPDFRMLDHPNTPHEKLIEAYDIARSAGLHYVFVGNVHDVKRQNTYCPQCGTCLIERDWYRLGCYNLRQNQCQDCGHTIAGRFADKPGDWGPKRQPIRISGDRVPQVHVPKTAVPRAAVPSSPILSEGSSRTVDMSSATENPIQTIDFQALSEGQRSEIHRLASRLVAMSVLARPITRAVLEPLGELAQQNVMGLFVTLKREHQLRGCCGLIGRPMALADAMLNAAHRTAKDDSRLPAISPSELPYLSLDVTLLAAPELIAAEGEALLDHIELGKHGLRIQQGDQAGLLLPSVPIEQGWSKREFLEGLCRKAGLEANAWLSNKVRVERFEGLPIEGQIHSDDYGGSQPRAQAILSQEDLYRLRANAAQNILALVQGATPSYYAPGVPDGTVHGLVLSLFNAESKVALAHLIRISFRPGIPLQASLFELCQTASSILQQSAPRRNLQLEVALTVLHDPALHGQHNIEAGQTIDRIPLQGVIPSQRAIVGMMSGSRVSVAFDPQSNPSALAQQSVDALSAHGRPVTVYSMEFLSTRPELVAHSAPAPQTGSSVRSTAVAGYFYPVEDIDRKRQVEGFLLAAQSHGKKAEKKPVAAIMVPHAALKYSGQVAADVWGRVEIPKTVLVIGPKHTPDGVDWGVAPHRQWQLSKHVTFAADTELAQQIADRVSGMQLDAGAHRREHGIEVQLPFLEILAPETQIAAVAMQGGSMEELKTAAKQLADVLRDAKEMPLLVISSDMNHYAPDDENRRRDRLALEAMKTCDPEKLLEVCTLHQISMCGLIPALLVMMTLRELGIAYTCEQVSYATSADAGAEKSRVVGYAGVILRAQSAAAS